MLRDIWAVAESCSVGWQDIRDFAELGIMPAPLIVGGFARWRQSDLDTWLADGCPAGAEMSEGDADELADALLHELKLRNAREKG